MNRTVFAILAAALTVTPALAQSAEERAQALKDWRANCSDDDPDLRLIYLEDAISVQGGTVARLCIREGLSSDDAETRALALRGALTLTDTLTIPFDMPLEYSNAVSAAGVDEDELDEIQRDWRETLHPFDGWGGMLTFKAEEVELFSTSSEWTLKMYSGRFNESQAPVRAVATGNGLKIDGVYFGNPIVVDLTLDPSGSLVGEMMFDGEGPYPILADLL